MIGLPTSSVSSIANPSRSSRTSSANRNSTRLRSLGSVRRHTPASNAARAALTASSTSLAEQRATCAMMRPSIGLFFSNTRPSRAETNLPSMKARPSGRNGRDDALPIATAACSQRCHDGCLPTAIELKIHGLPGKLAQPQICANERPIADRRFTREGSDRTDRQRSGRTGSRLGGRGGLGARGRLRAQSGSFSLKHHPGETVLEGALECCDEIARHAMSDADLDSEAFRSFIRTRSAAAAARLVDTGEKLAHLIDALTAVVDAVEPRIISSMAGDLSAARALAAAARRIQAGNEAEAQAYGAAQR